MRQNFLPPSTSLHGQFCVTGWWSVRGSAVSVHWAGQQQGFDLALKCPASGAQLVGAGSRWTEVWVGNEHRRNSGSSTGRSVECNGEESQDGKIHHCSIWDTEWCVSPHMTSVGTAETAFIATFPQVVAFHFPMWGLRLFLFLLWDDASYYVCLLL